MTMRRRNGVQTPNQSPPQLRAGAPKYHARGIGYFLRTKPDEGQPLQPVDRNFDQHGVAVPAP